MKELHVWTDGSSRPNPGKGGWAFVIEHHKKRYTGWGSDCYTTNNIMEMQAVIESLKFIQSKELFDEPYEKIVVHSDSQYVIKGASIWLRNWIRNGFKGTKGFIKNHERWIEIHKLSNTFPIDWIWVRGHNGEPNNELCDELAGEAMRGCK